MSDEVFGIPIAEGIPDGFTPLELVAVVKCLDEEGAATVVAMASDGLNTWEAIGMLTHTIDRLRQGLLEEDPDE